MGKDELTELTELTGKGRQRPHVTTDAAALLH